MLARTVLIALCLCLAEPALALCQRADGTYTNSCSRGDAQVKGGHVTRAERSTGAHTAPPPAAQQPGGPVQVEILPQRETDPRTYWGDRRRVALEGLKGKEEEGEELERRLAHCRQVAGIRHEGRCAGLEETVESSRQGLADARKRVNEQLFEDCRKDPACQPGYLR
jgi:hypothetical protein